MANRLVRGLPRDWEVVVVDRDDAHVYQPGLLFIPFGIYQPHDIVRPRRSFLSPEVGHVLGEIESLGDVQAVGIKGRQVNGVFDRRRTGGVVYD